MDNDIILYVITIGGAILTLFGNWRKILAEVKTLFAKAKGEEATAEAKRLENDRYAADTAFLALEKVEARLTAVEDKNDALRKCVEETRDTMDAQKQYYEAQIETLVAQRDAALAQSRRFREMALILQEQLEGACITPLIDVTKEKLLDFG